MNEITNTNKPRKSCCPDEINQPLSMGLGSAINLGGGIVSLILSAQDQKINPLPFIICSMLTSTLYLGSNLCRIYKLCTDKNARSAPEAEVEAEIETKPLSFQDKIKKEKITLTIER